MAEAWSDAGIDVDKAFKAAASVTDEWTYTSASHLEDPCIGVAYRFKPKCEAQRRTPLRLGTLQEILKPQPETANVLHGLLDWIDRADRASQLSEPLPPRCRVDGSPLFPEGAWWQTEMAKRARPEAAGGADMDDAPYDDADLTWDPHEAGGSSRSEAISDDGDSDASLPAGPSIKSSCWTNAEVKMQAARLSVATVDPPMRRVRPNTSPVLPYRSELVPSRDAQDPGGVPANPQSAVERRIHEALAHSSVASS